MKLLLDTHILIWALIDEKLVPEKARSMIADTNNAIYFSAVSVWEVALKHGLRPMDVPFSGADFFKVCQKAGYMLSGIKVQHILQTENLDRPAEAPPHKDPFDRLLLAQAIVEGMSFVTHDRLIPFYGEKCIIAV